MKKLLAIFIFALFALGAGNSQAGPCDDPDNNGKIFPHPTDCTKFIVCVSGYEYIGQCPPGLVFYPAPLQCDFPGLPGDPCPPELSR